MWLERRGRRAVMLMALAIVAALLLWLIGVI